MSDQLSFEGVSVNIERGSSGAFFATSPDMKGLHVGGMSREEVIARLPAAIRALHQIGGLSRSELERVDSGCLLRMHDDIHKIMEARAVDMKARHRAMTK